MFENIEKAVRKDLIGLDFVYKSKYGGEVKGNVKGVSITRQLNADKETNRRMLVGLSKKSPKVQITESDLVELTPDFRWTGLGFDIIITSENGISYNMKKDNIYFINKDE